MSELWIYVLQEVSRGEVSHTYIVLERFKRADPLSK